MMDSFRPSGERNARGVVAAASGCWLLAVSALLVGRTTAAEPIGDVPRGARISVIGNTLADRAQHFGWLEAMLHARFPNHHLTVRDLGFSGDELTLRLRSANFGSPDEWLTKARTDIVCAFFGYNESFGDPGRFRDDLNGFITHSLEQKYNGESAPSLILFSPIAHEDLKDRSLPDGKANNARLEALTAAMAEVAQARGVRFVDLFHPSQKMYDEADEPLTVNGVHLNSEGYRLLAEVVERDLFGDAPNRDPERLEKIRQAVLDKNFYWFNRYRTVDGYSIYGGRAELAFVNNQTNREVAAREMEVLDVMTANRDRRIWAVAAGGDLKVDDSNAPPFIPVISNKPGDGPNGEHLFLDGEEAIGKMTPGEGLKVNLFASEKEFPDLINPMQMTFDAKGRLWAASWPTYPHWRPKSPMNDKLLIFEDVDGDGKADKMTAFADDLHCPTGFEIVPGGVLVAQAPDLIFLKDIDGDDRADVRIRVLSGLDSADTHHTANSFRLGPGGDLFFQEGTFHHTQVETPYGPPLRNANAGVYRYEPRSQKFESFITFAFANPHGHVFDRWGQDFVTDGTGNVNYFSAAFSGHLDFPDKHRSLKPYFQQHTRPVGGTEILSSRHFPDEWQGDLMLANVIGFQGILRYRYQDVESGFTAVEEEPIVSSTDPNFRPVDIEMGPDGAIYFVDWQNPIIGHMQHNLRDPNRDHSHGRIYRVTYQDRPLSQPARIAGEPIETLLELLKSTEDRVRYRAKVELCARDPKQVLEALGKWVDGLDPKGPNFDHHLLEALWVHQFLDFVDMDLLKRNLTSREPRARAAAVRVLCCWRDRVPEALDLLRALAVDDHPRVRLEVVRAASFFTEPEALDVALSTTSKPSDYYIDYARGETLRALEPHVNKALAEGRQVEFSTDAAARYFLDRVDVDGLLKMKRARPVLEEILVRKGIREEDRKAALADLAKLAGASGTKVLIALLTARDAAGAALDESAVVELSRLLIDRGRDELTADRGLLETLAAASKTPVVRRLGLAALVAADGSADRAWELAGRSVDSLHDFLAAVPLIRDPIVRAGLYPRIAPLLRGLPAGLEPKTGAGSSLGRYVRIVVPTRATLTLAEVEVFSDGRNVARGGKASQSNTAHGGDAARGIDGNTSGEYAKGGQTHTQEMTSAPWWEVDLGGEFPIDAVVVYNRTDGTLGKRLDGYDLTVLDGRREVVYQKTGNPAPEPRSRFDVGVADPRSQIRRAAMTALTTIRGQEAPTFRALAEFVREGIDRQAAIGAIQKVPPTAWPDDGLKPLLDDLLAAVAKVPVADRRSAAAVDALRLGDMIAARLPADQARAARKALGELGVRSIRVGTVLEQMRYDVDRIVVQAGKPVEFVFENVDAMPHNFVITEPGALQEVGELAEATALQPDAFARQYVPVSNKILLASRLLQTGESQALTFTAPSQPGVHPYVCTYPGHWRRMYGALYVVADLDEYLADPEAYLAAHQVSIQDELLKSTRPRVEWTLDDLAPSIAHMEGRSYNNGKQLFQLATCSSCHRLEGAGNEFGPDLAHLDPKQDPAELLKNILDPSSKINDKYYGYAFELESGQPAAGLIVEETADVVKIVENPLASVEPRALPKSEITGRVKSPISLMPRGLLDKLTREEILDLLAYVAAGGDPANPLFQSQNGHAGHGH